MSAIFDDSPNPTPSSSYDADSSNYWSNNVYSSQTLSTVEGAAIKGSGSSANLGRTRSGRLTKRPRNADDDDSSIEDRKRLSESLSFHEYSDSNPIQPLLDIAKTNLFALDQEEAARQYSGPPSPESQPRQHPEHSRVNTSNSDSIPPLAIQSPTLGSPSLSPNHFTTTTSASTSTLFSHQLFSNPTNLSPNVPFPVGPFIPSQMSARPLGPGQTPSYQNKAIKLAPPPSKDQGLPTGFKAFATDANDVWTEDSGTCTRATDMEKQMSGGGDTEVDEEEAAAAARHDGPLTISTPSPILPGRHLPAINTKTNSLKGKAVIPVIVSSPKVSPRKRGRSASKPLSTAEQSGADGDDAEGEQYDDEEEEEEDEDEIPGPGQSRASTSKIAVADYPGRSPSAPATSTRRRGRRQSSAPSNPDEPSGPRDPITGRRIFNGLANNATQKVSIDAPIQKRQYSGESKTSRKEVPVAMKRVLKKVGKKRGEEVNEKEEVERIVREAREANTKAARLSRERKKAFLDNLQKDNEALKSDVEHWKERAERAEYELQEWKAGRGRS